MKKNKLADIIAYTIVGVIVIAVVYLFRVMPYDNDFSCIIAECRKIK